MRPDQHPLSAIRRAGLRAIVRPLVLVVLFRLVFCRLFRVPGGKDMVALRKMSVVPCRFVVTRLMVLRCFLVMTSGMLVMLGRFFVMLRTFMFGHFRSSSSRLRGQEYN
jgi:hypothetical protein